MTSVNLFANTETHRAPPPAADPGPERDADLLRCIEAVTAGDFSVAPAGDDPLSRAVARMIETFRDAWTDNLDRAVKMSIQANLAGIGNASMLAALREVDSRTQSIAAAVEEMIASIQEISRAGQSAAEEAVAVREAARVGTEAVGKAVESMQSIATAVEQASAQVSALAEASAQIGEIVTSIEDIAGQTNLLALNATIEAARAGEAGKGFAVVAKEVKGLSQQTAKATVDIRARIEKLREEMGGIVSSMEEGRRAVDDGRTVVFSLGEEMQSVEERVNSVTQKMDEIASALSQQTEASNEVSRGVATISEMTHQNVGQIETAVDTMDETETLIGEQIARIADLDIPNKVIRLAKADHVIWKKRLADMVVGRAKLRHDELSDHHSCRLGKWYYGDGAAKLRHVPAFGALEEPHKLVHHHGREAARLYAEGDLDGALREIEKVEKASVDVLRLLDELEAAAG